MGGPGDYFFTLLYNKFYINGAVCHIRINSKNKNIFIYFNQSLNIFGCRKKCCIFKSLTRTSSTIILFLHTIIVAFPKKKCFAQFTKINYLCIIVAIKNYLRIYVPT